MKIEAGPGVGHYPQGVHDDSGPGPSITPHVAPIAHPWDEVGDEWETIIASRCLNLLCPARTCDGIRLTPQVNPLTRRSSFRHLDALGDLVDQDSPRTGSPLNRGTVLPSGAAGRRLGKGGVHIPLATTFFSHTSCRYSTIRVSMPIVTRL